MSQALSAERLRELLHYDPLTGVFTRRSGWGADGRTAGGADQRGYVIVKVGGARHKAHRLAWLYVHGEWPKHTIDHINGVKDDNRIANLRDVPQRVNSQNVRKPLRRNGTGFLGVTRVVTSAGKTRYQAAVGAADGRRKKLHVGTYSTPEAAHQAYLAKKRELHEGNTL